MLETKVVCKRSEILAVKRGTLSDLTTSGTPNLGCIRCRMPWQVICWICFTSPILDCNLVWLKPPCPSFNFCAGGWNVDCYRWPPGVPGPCKLWWASHKHKLQVFTSPNHSEGFPFRLAVPSFGCFKETTCISDYIPFLSLRVHLWENGG